MSKSFKIILTVLGLIILWALTLYFRRAPIEQDLANQVKAVLSQPEFNQVAVSFEGRDGTLSGEVSSQYLADEAESLAKKLWGVRVIDNQLNVSSEKPGPLAELLGYFQNGKLVLEGIVPDDATRQQLIQKITAALGVGKAIDKLSIDPKVQLPDRFFDALTTFLGLQGIDNAGFSINQNSFVLKGAVPNEEIKNRFTTVITTALAPLDIQNELQIVSKPEAAPSLEALQKFLASNVIEFELGSSVLSNQSQQILDRAFDLIKQVPQANIEIAGHTDNQGSKDFNIRLSKSRAIAVRLYLLEKEIAPERLSIQSYGMTQPKAKNDTPEGRQRNRRVELRLK